MSVTQRQAQPGAESLAGEPRPGRGRPGPERGRPQPGRGRPAARLALLLAAWLGGGAWLGGAAGMGVASAANPADKGGGSGQRPPSRLRLVRPVGGLVPGRSESLRIETTGEHGQLLPAQHPLVIVLSGANGLTSTARVTVPAGASEVEVPIVAAKPGLWQVEARSDGLYSTSTVITCVAEAVSQRHKALAAAAPRAPVASAAPRAVTAVPGRIPAPGRAGTTGAAPTREARAPAPEAIPPAPRPAADAAGAAAGGPPGARLEVERLRVAPPAATAPPAPPRIARFAGRRAAAPSFAEAPGAGAARSPTAAAPSPTTAPPPSTGPVSGSSTPPAPAPIAPAPPAAATSAGAAVAGEVRLIPEKLERHRGPQGWEDVKIAAYWFEKGIPSPVSHDLRLALVSEEGNLTIAPVSLQIPTGDFESNQQAVVNVAAPATASLQALYPGGQSNRVQMSFLAAPAARLAFTSGSQVIPALGVASSEVYVRLLDAAGEPAVASQPIKVNLQLSGPLGSPLLPTAVIDAGAIETRVPIELPRFGAYTVLASAANLAPTAPLAIQVTFDWLVLLATLLGGLLGSLTRLLSQGQSDAAAPRRLLRVLLLGGLAALLVVLMSAFGLLSLLTGALPEGWSQALARVPLGSLTGVFLLGFLAGLLFDRIFGHLLSPGDKPAAAAGAKP